LNSESTTTSTPTIAQLSQARLGRWHQMGEALLTVENLRSWINAAGLVLFAPRAAIVAPAPTLVEAVLGSPSNEPPRDALNEAQDLLARLVADGIAVPLNLMGTGHGTPGDTPDFVASAAVFAYVFTLRGDKAWKQPPSTTGPLKVSNLALAAYEALAGGPLSAYDLATQLGKEVTETACLRALNEMWAHLRVIPLTQPEGRPTVWELASARFTKQIKAGANAGQPTALSALISLYLGQAMLASEDEMESFLSPLAPRSRIREVAHALLSARELETLVIEGKTLLHIPGESPALGGQPEPHAVADGEGNLRDATDQQSREADSRITKYVPRPRKIGTGYLAKGKPAAGKRPFDGERRLPPSEGSEPRSSGRSPSKGFGRPARRDEIERRPFRKPTGPPPERRFDKPWQEERPRRNESGDVRPARGARADRDRNQSARVEFRGTARPPRREARDPQRALRALGEFRRNEKQDRPPRPQRPVRPESEFRHRQSQDRPSRPKNATRSEAGERPDNFPRSRPAFRRFDAPKGERPRRRQEGEQRPQRPGADRGRSDFGPGTRPRNSNFKPRPPRRDGDSRPPRRNAESRPERGDRGAAARPDRKQSASRPFAKPRVGGAAKPRSGGGGGKFVKSAGSKRPFSKKPSGQSFKPRKIAPKRPRRDESA
jgi:23S rRNA pseudouridine2605 synthase